jgi:hypothetical protein
MSDFQMVSTHFLNIDKKLFNYKTSRVFSRGRFPFFLSFFSFSFSFSFSFKKRDTFKLIFSTFDLFETLFHCNLH